MEIIKTDIEEVVLIRPRVFADERGCFFESFSQCEFNEKVCNIIFVQDNESHSGCGVVRGLHYQLPPFAQSKLVRVVSGRVIDVAVDVRKGSPTFGRHIAVELSADNGLQLFVPRGFAHGFSVLSEEAVFQYKCDNYYSPDCERGVVFDDPTLAINWGVERGNMIISEKDRLNPQLHEAECFDYSDNPYER